MSRSLLGGSVASALLSVSLIFYAAPTNLAQATDIQGQPAQTVETASAVSTGETKESAGEESSTSESVTGISTKTHTNTALAPSKSSEETASTEESTAPPQSFVATAYSLRGRTASGRNVARGVIAADRRVLPLGTRVRLTAGSYSGEYVVADTGGAVRGRKIDVWVPNTSEAIRFGRRTVKLTVLSYGKKNSPRARQRQ